MTFAQKVFVCICIRANRFRYGAFGREANRTLKTLEIPSFENFPLWMKDADTAEVGGLHDVLSSVEAFSKVKPVVFKITGRTSVKVSDLFEVVYGSNLELNRLTVDHQGVNFVSRTSRNNGISGRVTRLPDLEPIPGGVLTVAGGGSVLETFYQAEPFYSGRDLYYLRPLETMTPEEMLFYAHVVRANQYRYSYGRQANRTLKDLLIPSRSQVPTWVYGAYRKVVHDVKCRLIDTLQTEKKENDRP